MCSRSAPSTKEIVVHTTPAPFPSQTDSMPQSPPQRPPQWSFQLFTDTNRHCLVIFYRTAVRRCRALTARRPCRCGATKRSARTTASRSRTATASGAPERWARRPPGPACPTSPERRGTRRSARPCGGLRFLRALDCIAANMITSTRECMAQFRKTLVQEERFFKKMKNGPDPTDGSIGECQMLKCPLLC